MLADFTPSIEQIHNSGKKLVIAVTGGGSGAISSLLSVPGASRSILEAIVPYDQRALEEWVGGQVEQACTSTTARAMAMAAFQRALHLSGSGDCLQLNGIAATAGLATDRPKRGPHRAHLAWQSARQSVAISLEFEKGTRSRFEEEQLTTHLLLNLISEACGVESQTPDDLRPREKIERIECQAPSQWTELLLSKRPTVLVTPPHSAQSKSAKVIFPGAFNPLHAGHREMARIAEEKLDQPVTFELSITNVDKAPLDFLEIQQRLEQFTDRAVLLTRAPTFVEKAAIAPGATFIVGADTLERIGEPTYYGNSPAERDAAIERLAKMKIRFLVFGRQDATGFRDLDSLVIPKELFELCEGVPEAEFRADVSSTQIRSASESP